MWSRPFRIYLWSLFYSKKKNSTIYFHVSSSSAFSKTYLNLNIQNAKMQFTRLNTICFLKICDFVTVSCSCKPRVWMMIFIFINHCKAPLIYLGYIHTNKIDRSCVAKMQNHLTICYFICFMLSSMFHSKKEQQIINSESVFSFYIDVFYKETFFIIISVLITVFNTIIWSNLLLLSVWWSIFALFRK